MSFLLIGLIALAMLVGVRETFHDVVTSGASPLRLDVELSASPALKNLLTQQQNSVKAQAPQVDTLTREKDAVKAWSQQQMYPPWQQQYDRRPPASGPCPDMSNYIRMDEVPCWNCSLP